MCQIRFDIPSRPILFSCKNIPQNIFSYVLNYLMRCTRTYMRMITRLNEVLKHRVKDRDTLVNVYNL